MPTYRIVRFFRPDSQKTQPKNLPTGLTLDEAQEIATAMLHTEKHGSMDTRRNNLWNITE